MIVSGIQIRAARALAGMSQGELAEAANLHQQTIAYWERHGVIPEPETRALLAMRQALERKGIVTFAEPAPGVMLAGGGR